MNARWQWGLRAPALACMLLVGACKVVGPDYVRPSAPVPAAYKEAAADGRPDASLAPQWWRLYQDPVLDALIAQVAVDNQSLAAATARVQQARQLVAVAGAATQPQVFAGSIKTGRSNENDFGLGASWEIDLWGRIKRDIEAHRAAAQASADDLAAATLSMQAQVAKSYFMLRERDAAIALLRHVEELDDQAVRRLRNQYAQGVVAQADLAAALARLGGAQRQLGEARATRAQLEHAIAVMLGKPPADFAIAPAAFDARLPAVPAGLPAKLLERRPDVAASERRMAAANARIGVSQAETLPSISLAAGIGVREGPTGTVNIHAPLFTGGELQARVGHERAAYAESVANYRQKVLDALREVEDNLAAARALTDAAAVQAAAAQAAREAERVAVNQYRQGVIDHPALVQATSAMAEAGQAELQLKLRRLDISVDLIEALGGGWQADAERASSKPVASVDAPPAAR